MNELLLKMVMIALVVALGLSILSDSILSAFGLSLAGTITLVPIAYYLRSRRELNNLFLNGFALRLGAVVVVALIILPYYAARNSADASYYDTQAGLIADQIRAGAWWQIDLRAGTEMVSFVTALLYIPFGPSSAGMTFISGLLGFVGSLCFVGAAAESLPLKRLKQYAIFVMMLPSVVFWSTLFGKDSWVFFGLGISALGTAQWLRYRRWGGAAKMLIGFGITFAFRPYVALIVVLSLAFTTFFASERHRLHSPLSVIKSVFVLVLLIPLTLFMWKGVSQLTGVTEVSEESIVGRISQQGSQTKLGGGSDVDSTEIQGTGGFVRQLPEGAIRLLFRPWPWEATSFFMFVAALDNLVLIIVLVARRRNLMNAFRNIRTLPYQFFCLLCAIGLTIVFSTISNLGLLMREKTQVTPFLYVLAFSGERERKRKPQPVTFLRPSTVTVLSAERVAASDKNPANVGVEPGA